MEHIKTITLGDLSFNRLKNRGPVAGPGVMNFEFMEIYKVTLDPTVD